MTKTLNLLQGSLSEGFSPGSGLLLGRILPGVSPGFSPVVFYGGGFRRVSLGVSPLAICDYTLPSHVVPT